MEPDAAVGGRDDVAAVLAPGGDDPVDRPRVELGPVRERDERRLRLRRQRREPAAQRGPGPELPVRAAHGRRIRLDIVRAEHDEDAVERRSSRAARPARCGSSSACFGGEAPYREDAPAASTTAWTDHPRYAAELRGALARDAGMPRHHARRSGPSALQTS